MDLLVLRTKAEHTLREAGSEYFERRASDVTVFGMHSSHDVSGDSVNSDRLSLVDPIGRIQLENKS